MRERLKIFTNGIIKENPVWVLLLGTCPTLATTSTVFGGVGMGLSMTFVLICSNIAISALKKCIPGKVRIPAYIVIIAGFVTVLGFIVQGFLPSLYKTLGIFLPLIVVNCIILARAEAFASKNKIIDSVLDAIGMGLGFTLALFLIGSFRELLAQGGLFGFNLIPEEWRISLFSTPAGGFLAFAFLIALISLFGNAKTEKKCGACGLCNMNEEKK